MPPSSVVALCVLLAVGALVAPGAARRLDAHRAPPGRSRRGSPPREGRRRSGRSPGPGRPGAPGAGPSASSTALVLDLVGAAVAAGAAPVAAIALVGAAIEGAVGRELLVVAEALALGAPPEVAWASASPRWAPLRRCLRLAEASGAPITALLREAATAVRHQAQRDALVASARLSVRVVLPLGLCALPAFVLLGVAPVVLALGGQLLGG